jgi:hypothetical protein
MWSIQDSLLQAYRGIFITTQSIVFAIAVFIASNSRPLFAIFLALLGFCLLVVWFLVCLRRGLAVWFFQWHILLLEKGESVPQAILSEFKQWQSSKGWRALKGNHDWQRLTKSQTRFLMDKTLPVAFGALWIFLIVYAFWRW